MNRLMSERAKKLRAILRAHYTRDDMTVSLTELLLDARLLAKQRGLPFEELDRRAAGRYADERAAT